MYILDSNHCNFLTVVFLPFDYRRYQVIKQRNSIRTFFATLGFTIDKTNNGTTLIFSIDLSGRDIILSTLLCLTLIAPV